MKKKIVNTTRRNVCTYGNVQLIHARVYLLRNIFLLYTHTPDCINDQCVSDIHYFLYKLNKLSYIFNLCVLYVYRIFLYERPSKESCLLDPCPKKYRFNVSPVRGSSGVDDNIKYSRHNQKEKSNPLYKMTQPVGDCVVWAI